MTLTAEQCRMARAALDWTTRELADYADIAFNTVNRFERGGSSRSATLAVLRSTFEAHGIRFFEREDGGKGVIYYPPADAQA